MKLEQIAASDLYARASDAARPTAPDQADDAAGFADALEAALRDMHATVQRGERAATDAMAGTADVQSVVEALTATEMALETAVVMRDRIVEAYQEILRMPV